MSYFNTKMHQMRFRLGLRPTARWSTHSAPPEPLAAFKGSHFKEKEGHGRVRDGKEKDKGLERERKRMEREGRGKEGRNRREGSPPYFVQGPLSSYIYKLVTYTTVDEPLNCFLSMRIPC